MLQITQPKQRLSGHRNIISKSQSRQKYNTVNFTGRLNFDDVRVTDTRLQTTGEGKLEPTNAG